METLQRALSSHSKLSSNQISLFPNPSTNQNFCFISKHKEFFTGVLNLPYSCIPIAFLHLQWTSPKISRDRDIASDWLTDQNLPSIQALSKCLLSLPQLSLVHIHESGPVRNH